MSASNSSINSPESHMASSLVTEFVFSGALFGVIFGLFLAGSQGQAAGLEQELARRDSSQFLTHNLQKSNVGQITQLEPIGLCRDPLVLPGTAPQIPQRSVLIMAAGKDIPKMRKDETLFEQALRRSPIAKASLIVQEFRHQREVVVGQLEGLYLIRGYNDELRVTGTIDEMGSDGAFVTKAINMELSSGKSNFASFSGNQVFECRLTHPQLIRFEQ